MLNFLMEFYFHIASGEKNQFSVALSLKYKHSEWHRVYSEQQQL